MVRAIYAFTSSDGTIFSTREAAEIHEAKILLRKKFTDIQGMTLDEIAANMESLSQLFAQVKKDFRGFETVDQQDLRRQVESEALAEAVDSPPEDNDFEMPVPPEMPRVGPRLRLLPVSEESGAKKRAARSKSNVG